MSFLNEFYALVMNMSLASVLLIVWALSLTLIIFLIAQARHKSRYRLKQHRSGEPGVADLLNWSSVIDNGVILNKNGSLSAAWVYKGNDNASATNADRNAVSRVVNSALIQLGSGWMAHVDAIRRPCPSYSHPAMSHFPDAVSKAIDEERRHYFENLHTLYEGCYVLTVTYFPPPLAQAKFVELMFDDPSNGNDTIEQRGDKILFEFQKEIRGLENRLSSVLSLERLGAHQFEDENGQIIHHDDFLRWLQYCLTGINQPIYLPQNPSYIDCLLGGQDLTVGTVPLIGSKYIKVVAIDNFPFESSPGVLAALAELPCDYRWSTRYIFLDNHEAVSLIAKYKRKWKQKIRGWKDTIFRTSSNSVDQDALAMYQDCDLALMEVNSGVVAMGLFTSNVVLMGEDLEQLENNAYFVQKVLGTLGFPARIEDINTVDAFLGTLPGHGTENVRRTLMNTRHVADLIPTSSIWTGRDMAPCDFYPPNSPPLLHCVTSGSTPFRLNLHVGDIGHTIVFGPTGAGKSTLLGILAAQLLRYKHMSVYAFDKGNSLYTLCQAIGGDHYAVAGEEYRDAAGTIHTKHAFCPLQWLDSPSDLSWACSWIESLLELNGVNVSSQQRNEIAHRMRVFEHSEERTLLAFVTGLMDSEMTSALEPYTREGMYGYLMDANSDSLDLKNNEGGFTVFEIEELMGLGDPKIVLPVLLYLFRRVEKSLHGQPAVIILDEAWLMLGHPVFKNKIREWLKVLRKANCSVVMATQSLSDAVNSEILDVIRESTATKIFLPNPHAMGEDTAEVYRRMGLNSRQIQIVANAISKRQYYLTSEEGNRLFELSLGPLQLALVAVSDRESVAKVKEFEQRYGDAWVYEWLAFQGVQADVIQRIKEEAA